MNDFGVCVEDFFMEGIWDFVCYVWLVKCMMVSDVLWVGNVWFDIVVCFDIYVYCWMWVCDVVCDVEFELMMVGV